MIATTQRTLTPALILALTFTGCAVDATHDLATEREFAAGKSDEDHGRPEQAFHVKSYDFHDGDALAAKYTCEGGPFQTGVTPELKWNKGPEGTKSYAIVLADTTLLDQGLPNLGFHWAIWNISGDVRTLPEGLPGLDPANPAGVPLPESLGGASQSQARGFARYFAPCPSWTVTQAQLCGITPVPPRTTDHYAFIVYAIGEENITVPPYDRAVNPNYVDTLNSFFQSKSVGSTRITMTADAVPTTTPPVGCPAPQ